MENKKYKVWAVIENIEAKNINEAIKNLHSQFNFHMPKTIKLRILDELTKDFNPKK